MKHKLEQPAQNRVSIYIYCMHKLPIPQQLIVRPEWTHGDLFIRGSGWRLEVDLGTHVNSTDAQAGGEAATVSHQ